ncbi:MAG: hypothetical protein R3F49_06065 [Planctomycetota bacterium]
MTALIVEDVPGRGDVRVVLLVRPGVYHRGDLGLAYSTGKTLRVELAPRLVRLLLALVAAYHAAPPAHAYGDDALFGEDDYRGQVHPIKLGQLYGRVSPPAAVIEPKTVRSYVSELRHLVRRALEQAGDPTLVDPEVIAGGDGYRIGRNGIEVRGYDRGGDGPQSARVTGAFG